VSRLAACIFAYVEHEQDESREPLQSQSHEFRCYYDVASHRDALISSMYMGGAGAFLALPALCMWNITASACFVLILTGIGFFMEDAKIAEFKANVDTASAVTSLRKLRWAHSLSLAMAGVWIAYLDSYYEQQFQWPLIMLASASPLLLRIGSVRMMPLTKMLLTPAQSLETGLPVSTLLAILVLCWYSPVERLIVKDDLFARTAIPMLVLCPPCLAAVMAFILSGFHHKRSSAVATMLLIACAIRQQAVDRRMKTWNDAASIFITAQATAFLLWIMLYKHRAVAETVPLTSSAASAAGSTMLVIENYEDDVYMDDDDDDVDSSKGLTSNETA
jgi:hypothetical protein